MNDRPACTRLSAFARKTRLVVNADDFGLTPRINEGILHAHRQGIVTSTSLMAVGRAFEHAVHCCRTTPALDVGVHLTVVAERPLLAKTSLSTQDGQFPASAGAFLRRWFRGGIRRADLEAEWSAQIEHVLAQGIRVTHLDSHQHLHILPGLADLSRRLAARYHIPFIRLPMENPWRWEWPDRHAFNRMCGAAVLGGCGLLAHLTARQPTPRSLRFLGFHDGGRLDCPRLARLLRSLRPGQSYELMCHPGLSPDEPDVRDWGYQHETEMLALTDPAILSEITNRDIQLCSFAGLEQLHS